MLTTFIVLLSFGTKLYGDIITHSPTSTTPSPIFDLDDELTKISSFCLQDEDFEKLTGNAVKLFYARQISFVLVDESVACIGLAELRSALNFAPPPHWKPHNYTKPSKSELQNAPTLEAYYELREPRDALRSLDSKFLFEHNVDAAVVYLDEHLPSIRRIFRNTFEAKRSKEGKIDKTVIDHMIDEYLLNVWKVDEATSEILRFSRPRCTYSKQ